MEFDYNSVICEYDIESLSEKLEDLYPLHVNNREWFPIKFYISSIGRKGSLRCLVDDVIDNEMDNDEWRRLLKNYIYDDSDRREIVSRCAERIKKRVMPYAGRYSVRYKIFNNGQVGFRYE